MANAARLADLWRAWPVAGPWRLAQAGGGTNSAVWRAETAHGSTYALRVLDDPAAIAGEAYVAALLRDLATRQLSFQVPALIATPDGAYLVPVPESNAVATLAPWLPGAWPDRDDLALTTAAGMTLAALHRAWSGAPPIPPALCSRLPPFGEVVAGVSLPGDPHALLAQLPGAADDIQRLRAWLERVQATAPALAARLPRQIVHRDYDPSNMLAADGAITGVLDFELAGPDARALDLAVALSWWPVDALGTGREWTIIDAFGRGYQTNAPECPWL